MLPWCSTEKENELPPYTEQWSWRGSKVVPLRSTASTNGFVSIYILISLAAKVCEKPDENVWVKVGQSSRKQARL